MPLTTGPLTTGHRPAVMVEFATVIPFRVSIFIAFLLAGRSLLAQEVTFNNQVVRLFQQQCQTCHRPGNIAPFSLLTHAEAQSRAASIKRAVQSREMPPWKPVNADGVFDDERTLTDQEIQTIVKWVDDGAPEGVAADMPDPVRFPEEWTLREPDSVLQPDEAYRLDPNGGEVYRCFTMTANNREDVHVRGMEVLPGNRIIVHHVLLFIDQNGVSVALDNADPGPGYTCFGGPGFIPESGLGGWVPGMMPQMFPLGIGARIPAGARVVMQVHYSPLTYNSHQPQSGAPPDADRTRVGLYTSPVSLRPMSFWPVVNPFFQIPAGASRHEVRAFLPIVREVDLIGIAPHMHLLGREVTVDALFPNLTTRRLIHIGDWDFEWQGAYTYRQPVRLPVGTLVTMRAIYDNSASNPKNPSNPPVPVRWGEKTTDEMCLTFLVVTEPGARPLTAVPFTATGRGGISVVSEGGSGLPAVGYGRVTPQAGAPSPSGLAIFGYRQNNVLVTEAAVAAAPLVSAARVFAEVRGAVNSGIAIANPGAEAATVAFSFVDGSGKTVRTGTLTVAANAQVARFLNEAPFNVPAPFEGAFSFSSSRAVSAVALRGVTNERSEFLITTLPVTDLASVSSQALVFPHFADGGGWTTQILLVNPTDEEISGIGRFIDPSGQPQGAEFSYVIPARGARRYETSGSAAATRIGSVRLTPAANTSAPFGSLVFSHRRDGVRVTEAGVPALAAAPAFRLYVEASGNFDQSQAGSLQSGIAVANTSSSPATVNLELTDLQGRSAARSTLTVPGNGQAAAFLNQIPGFGALRLPLQGVLRVTSGSPITVVGLRGRYNERRDFLVTTTPPVAESGAPSTAELFFPHFASGGGYTTQFILFSGTPQSLGGMLRFFSTDGQPLSLGVR